MLPIFIDRSNEETKNADFIPWCGQDTEDLEQALRNAINSVGVCLSESMLFDQFTQNLLWISVKLGIIVKEGSMN